MPLDEDEARPESDGDAGDGLPVAGRRKRWKIVLLAVLALLLVVAGVAWLNREQVAENVIANQLEELGVPARYEIREITAGHQLFERVVVGDPARPDLTIDRIEVETGLRYGLPRFARVTLVRPRLYGSYRGGKLSFGSLDPLIFTDSKEPFELPDLALDIRDGRGLLESDFGPVGFKAQGEGELRGGFAGVLAGTAPRLAFGGCEAANASLYGKLGVTDAMPRFEGPLRLGSLGCEGEGLRLGKSGAQIAITLDRGFDGGEAQVSIAGGPAKLGASALHSLSGKAQASYRRNALVGDYSLAGEGLAAPGAALASLTVSGRVRSSADLAQIDVEGALEGKGLAMGGALDRALASGARAGEGTMVQPVLSQIRSSLARESRGSSLSGRFILRNKGESASLVVPQAAVKGGSGKTLLSISRLRVALGGSPGLPLTGNFATGGEGLPKIAGRMEGDGTGRLAMHIHMPEYRAGSASLELPRLVVMQQAGGALGFDGEARLSGAIPQGRVAGLAVPLEGAWSSSDGLAVWRRCQDLRFESLELAELRLAREKLALCPPRGKAMVRSTPRGIAANAAIASLDLAGWLGSSPVRITAGAIALGWPGKLSARDIAVALGPAGDMSDFRIGRIEGQLGGATAGRFEDASMLLAAVPLDVLDASAFWRFEDGGLSLSEGSFRLEDREQVDRFQPLVARDATLRLAGNVIAAEARLREPGSLREIVRTELRHDLTVGVGAADLFADGVHFDKVLQPDTLTYLALGVIANAQGEVRGTGRIDWNELEVTSSGEASTDSLDFAAAFGPVQGVSGTVTFTDLLGLVTAPGQQLRVAAINPGIEVDDGIVTFAIEPNYVLRVQGAKWPFLGGTLTLQPVTMNLGVAETRRYDLTIEDIDAARFLERIEMDNLSATGRFEGEIPLVFDEQGGRIEGGRLVSLPPGGNVSYIGKLTYEDLSAMGNYAFDALRSIDYRRMRIDLDGALEGEIITRVTFDGLGQGKLAKRNFITKQVARLPIRFNVNVRAPFFRLVTSVRSMFDVEYLRNPETLGLLDLPVPPGEVVSRTTAVDQPVQPPVSERAP